MLQVYETLLTYMCLTHSPIPRIHLPFHFHVHYHPRSFFLVPRCRAQVQVNALVLEHVFATQGQVGTQVGGHFKQQLRAKAVKLLGGGEVVGNPAGLVRSLGTFMEKRDEERYRERQRVHERYREVERDR